jgi:hypothetical protein
VLSKLSIVVVVAKIKRPFFLNFLFLYFMAQQSHKTTFLQPQTMSSSSIGTCMICVAENVTLIKMPCCSYEQCDTCVSKWKKGGNISCPQCRKVIKTASLAPAPRAPARKAAPRAAAAADVELDDDVQLALASSMESHEAECKKFETLESQWAQNLEWAISESLSVVSSAPHTLRVEQEAKEMEEALKLSEVEQSREDVELRAALKESSTFSASSAPELMNMPEPSLERKGKRKRVECFDKLEDEEAVDVESSEQSFKTPEAPEACYKLIRSNVPVRARGGKQAMRPPMRPSMLLSSADGDSSLPVDVSLRAALELSMKPQRLFRLEREIERGDSTCGEPTCCQGDLSKPCRSTCPFFQRK